MMSSYYYHHDGHHLLWCICEVVAPRHTLMMRKRQASKTPPETLARIDPKKKKTGGKDRLPTLNRLHLGKSGKSGKVDVYGWDAKQTARANKKNLKILSQSTQVSKTPIRSDTSGSWCQLQPRVPWKMPRCTSVAESLTAMGGRPTAGKDRVFKGNITKP